MIRAGEGGRCSRWCEISISDPTTSTNCKEYALLIWEMECSLSRGGSIYSNMGPSYYFLIPYGPWGLKYAFANPLVFRNNGTDSFPISFFRNIFVYSA